MRFLIGILFLVAFIGAYAQPPKKFYCRYGGNGYDEGNDVKQTLDGGYIITGSTSSIGQGNTDMYLLKLDSMGQVKFQKTFGGVSNEIGKSIVQLADSSYVMAGYTSSIGVGGYDVFLVKADKTGNLIWQKTYGGSDWDFANSMDTITGGGFIIAGTTYSYGKGNADGFVIKTDANGDTTWTKTFGGLKDDEFKSVIQTSDGNYALTGYTKSFNDSLGDVWALKLDVNGDTLWRKFYGGVKEDFGNQIIEHPNGDFFIAGGTESFGVGKIDGYALKTNNMGVQLSHQEHGYSGYDEEFTSIIISKRNSTVIGFMEKEFFSGFNLQFKLFEWTSNFGYINGTDYGSIDNDETFKLIATKDKGYACIGYTKGYGAINSDVYFLKSDSNLVGSTSIVSINELTIDENVFQKFPNPSSNEINFIANSGIQNTSIKLYDILGNEISIEEKLFFISNKHFILKVEHLVSGIYFISIANKIEKISVVH
jgi:hypothetical protein